MAEEHIAGLEIRVTAWLRDKARAKERRTPRAAGRHISCIAGGGDKR